MKKLFVILILSVFMLSFASATNWDNYLKYEKETDTITIKNTFGLGRDLIKAQLKDNFCDEEGRFCEADKTIQLFEEGALIEDWKTLRIDDDSWNEQNIRWHKFEYFGTIDDYETQCEEIKIIQENGTSTKQVCEHVKIGEHKDWIQFKEGDIFSKGIYQVRTTGEIRPGRVYDWQIKIAGKWTTPWATWGNISLGDDAEVILNSPVNGSILSSNPATFNTSTNITVGATLVNMSLWTNESGSWEIRNVTYVEYVDINNVENLTSYYKLDETSGIVIDELGVNNGTNNGATPNVSGLINTAYDFEAGDVDYISMGDVMDFNFLSDTFSASFWVKLESTVATNTFIAKQKNADPYDGYSLSYDSSGRLVFEADATGSITIRKTTTLNTGEWYYLVFTYNGNGHASGVKMYINSTEQTGLTIADDSLSSSTVTSEDFKIGARGAGNINPLDGIIDEVGIWDKVLSQSDITLYYNSGIGQIPGGLLSTQTWDRTIVDDIIWNSQACDSDGDCGFAPNNYSLFVDKTVPTISITSPNETFNYLKVNGILNLNITAIDSFLDTCWYNYNGTNTTFSCTSGVQANETFLQEADNFNITVYVNDSTGNENSKTVTWSYKVFENSRTLNSSSYETKSELFQIDVTNGANLTAVTLDYNGTEYSTTKSGDVYSKTLDIPVGVQNRSVRWKFTYSGDTIYSDYSYQNISETVWTLCNASYTDDYLNISFKDESTLSLMNGTIQTSTWNYYLGSGSVNKTYIYSTSGESLNYTFCATPNQTFSVDLYVNYLGDGYPNRIWEPELQTYNTTVSQQLLYLLSSTDGIYTTFVTATSFNTAIPGVDITISRDISGETTIVSQGITDSAGSFTAWVNPNYDHTIVASKTGYITNTQTIKPTQTSYTLVMSTGADEYTYVSDYEGLKWFVFPGVGVRNSTDSTDFGFNISARKGNLINCKIELLNNDKTLVLASAISASVNGSSCEVLVAHSMSSTYPKVKGRLLIDVGNGYQLLEDDAYWIYLTFNSTGMTFTDWFTGLTDADLKYFNDNDQHREYTYVLLFFLLMMIICAVLNYAGWDIQTSGGMIYLIGIFIWIASVPGFLNLSGISPYVALDKFFVAIVYTMFMIGFTSREFT